MVHGQVLGSPKRLPVAGARVAAGEQSVVTDAAGRFQLERGPPARDPGGDAAGFLTETVRLPELAEGATTKVEILLRTRTARFREQLDVVAPAEPDGPAELPVRPPR